MRGARFHPFPDTHWSLVRRAGLADEAARREALSVLLTRYEPALQSYLHIMHNLPPDEAQELLQAFIADRILQHDLLRQADANRGRFRALLLTSLRNFTISHHRLKKARATMPLVSDLADRSSPSTELTIDIAWARSLVNNVIHAMREECERTRRLDIWAVFEERLLAEIFRSAAPASYEDLAVRLELSSPTQAANLLVTAKRMYARLLRAAVAEYEPEPSGIDDEIVDLRRILAFTPADNAE